jgi:hypothetical protein
MGGFFPGQPRQILICRVERSWKGLGAHIEPFQDPEITQTSFHIILDMERHMLEDPNLQNLPHEIYRIRHDDQGIL